MTDLDPSHAPPNPEPEDAPEIPKRNEDEWLAIMAQWTDDELLGTIHDPLAPNSAKISARQRIAANKGEGESRFAKPGSAFDRITNRTLGKPKEDPKFVINQTKVLNIGTSHLFDNIAAYLAGENAPIEDFRLEPRSLLAGPDNGKDHPKEPARKRSDPQRDPAGGGG